MSVNNKFYFSLLFCIVLSLTALAAPTAAQVSAQPTPVGYGMTSGRLVASTSAVLALIGVIIGVLALVRPNGLFGTASGRLGAFVALAGGLIGTALGGLTAATAGGIGTGGGLAGAVIALVLGLIALALGGLALTRSRRTA
jgi:hypothetical protein